MQPVRPLLPEFRCAPADEHRRSHNALYWCDINRFLIHRFTAADQCVRSWVFDEPITALALTNRAEVLLAVLSKCLDDEEGVDKSQKHNIEFLEARRAAAEAFQSSKQVLHWVALLV
jgi:hypothetical protein